MSASVMPEVFRMRSPVSVMPEVFRMRSPVSVMPEVFRMRRSVTVRLVSVMAVDLYLRLS